MLSELDQHLQSQQQLIFSDEFGSPSDDNELSAIGLEALAENHWWAISAHSKKLRVGIPIVTDRWRSNKHHHPVV